MKRVFSILVLCVISIYFLRAQTPERIKYQTVIRDSDGKIIENQTVSLMIEILQYQTQGNVVCNETFNLQTNSFGLVNLEVGSKDTINFKSINWADGPFFLRVSVNGTIMGTTELLSVPYALYAKSSGDPQYWQPQQGGIFYNNGNIGVGTYTPDSSALLEISSNSKGFLPPRMTSDDIMHITGPANGLIVFCTTNNKFYAYLAEEEVWREIAYGNSTITPQDSCWYTITVNHTQGSVAPVTKTVTYGTVTDVPGEPAKCWLTSNLGADHQAVSVDDASEASAGWYWQFNRAQGYKHDGVTRTPNTAWISYINENLDWLPQNDPCAIEIGNGWRMPTQSEWVNVNDYGGWETWLGPWNSPLKMHAAGDLNYLTGGLTYRGQHGYYWCNLAGSNTTAWHELFNSTLCGYAGQEKPYGFSIRCVRN